MEKQYRAVFFDLGGTLRIALQEEPYLRHARRKMAEIAGTDLPYEEFYQLVEARYEPYRKWALEEFKESGDEELWCRWLLPDYDPARIRQVCHELSFQYRQSKGPITALLSMIISYLVVKRKFKSKGFIEAVSMLAMAVPGTVLGVGYIRGFSSGVFGSGFLQGLYGTGLILIIVFVVRSLPTGTRSGISALRQIDKSIEESAYDMGADSFKVFMTVTLPLIKDSFLSGLVTAFVRSITAISAIILLVTPQFLLITVQINEFAEKGSYSLACAFATILIVITYGAVLLMNLFMKYFGTSRKLKEGK